MSTLPYQAPLVGDSPAAWNRPDTSRDLTEASPRACAPWHACVVERLPRRAVTQL